MDPYVLHVYQIIFRMLEHCNSWLFFLMIFFSFHILFYIFASRIRFLFSSDKRLMFEPLNTFFDYGNEQYKSSSLHLIKLFSLK